jgi:PTH1 family peptidyl-tRNA hydrolase
MVRLIVFLGNPGTSYRRTRHNVGWLLAEKIAGTVEWREKFNGEWVLAELWNRQLHLLKPGLYMNRSGESVSAAARFFRIPPGETLVVHDEIELPFGELSLRLGGGTAGHNGLRSIVEHAGTPDFFRLRIGISRPQRGSVSSYVLSRFSSDEEILLPRILEEGGRHLGGSSIIRSPTPESQPPLSARCV